MPDPIESTSTEPVATPPANQAPVTDPEFDGDFDAERAKRLIENLRADKARLAEERDGFKTKVDTFETEKLSEQDRIAKELSDAREELARTRRAAALATHKLPDSALVFLTGSTPEEIETQAAALAALNPPADPAPSTPAVPNITTTVTPRLLPNGEPVPTAPEPFDPAAIAAAARRRRF